MLFIISAVSQIKSGLNLTGEVELFDVYLYFHLVLAPAYHHRCTPKKTPVRSVSLPKRLGRERTITTFSIRKCLSFIAFEVATTAFENSMAETCLNGGFDSLLPQSFKTTPYFTKSYVNDINIGTRKVQKFPTKRNNLNLFFIVDLFGIYEDRIWCEWGIPT